MGGRGRGWREGRDRGEETVRRKAEGRRDERNVKGGRGRKVKRL